MSAIIEVEQLSKTFTTRTQKPGFWGSIQSLFSREHTVVNAVDAVSFTVDEGEVVGYVGPNGAGKSTTIKMLIGLLYPSSGRVSVCGLSPSQHRRENLMHIGSVFGQRTQLWWDLPLIESLELLKHIYQVPDHVYHNNLDQFADLLDIQSFMHKPVRQLSLGQRMRGDIAAALLHNPDILYLDEPTIGLDVVVKERIRQFIKEINQERSTTVILTTHDLADIGALCERIIIIDHGKIIYDGLIDVLKQRFGSESTLVVDFSQRVDEVRLDGVESIALEGIRAHIRFDRKRTSASELIPALTAAYPVQDLTIEDTPLDGIIRGIYEEGQLASLS
ncbi:MAG: ATP-binding cassette domain-containing protein [Chloroflexota bacterium]